MAQIVLDTNLGRAKEAQRVEMPAPKYSHKLWKRTNDPGMIPDKGFVKQLKKLDPLLDVVWDFGSNKWEIWCFPKDKPGYHVLTVQTNNKSYRELGQDILIKLTLADTKKYSTQQILDFLDEHNNQIERRKAIDFKNKIESISSETFDFTRGVMKIQVPRNLSVRRVIANAES